MTVDLRRSVHESGQQLADVCLKFWTAQDRLLADNDGSNGPERLPEGLEAAPTAIAVRDGRGRSYDLIVELAGPDDPVDGVLQGAGQAMAIFGRSDEDRIARSEGPSPRRHRRRNADRLEFRVEERKLSEQVWNGHLDADGCDPRRRSQEIEIRGTGLEAPADAEDVHVGKQYRVSIRDARRRNSRCPLTRAQRPRPGQAYGSVSGTMRTAVVNFSGSDPGDR